MVGGGLADVNKYCLTFFLECLSPLMSAHGRKTNFYTFRAIYCSEKIKSTIPWVEIFTYISYIGMCHSKGYGFQAVWTRIGHNYEKRGQCINNLV